MLKTKNQKVLGANSYFVEVTRDKLVGGRGAFLPPLPILNRVKKNQYFKTKKLVSSA